MRTNVLILGKSGVGKSSLLNYLWGDNVAKVGAGKPQTGEGVYPYDPIKFKNIDIAIYDSYGLEANKASRWHKIIEDEVKKHDCNIDPLDWFHSVIYCVDAKRARIEEFEIEEILKPLANKGNRICFALTKCDVASENEIKSLENILKSKIPNHSGIHRVCADPKKTIGGGSGVPFGKETLLNGFINNLAANLSSKMIANHTLAVDSALKNIHSNIERKFASDLDEWFSDVSDCFKKIKIYAEHQYREVDNSLKNDLLNTSKICCELYDMSLSQFFNIDNKIRRNNIHDKTKELTSHILDKDTYIELILRNLFSPILVFVKKSTVYKDDIHHALCKIESHIKENHTKLVEDIVLIDFQLNTKSIV